MPHRSFLAGLASLVQAVLFMFAFHGLAGAQVTTATLYVVVQDPSGAVIPQSRLTLHHTQTGASRTLEMGDGGEFAFEFVPIGEYRLEVEAPGFKPYAVPSIQLGAGQKLRLSAQLVVGTVTDALTVADTPPQINAVSPEQRQSISELEVKQLPLARRDISNAVALGSGIQQDTSRGNAYVMNGLGKSAASITMDGIDASASPELPQTNLDGGFNYIGVVSLEAVEEVQVTKGVFAAEYARALSGNVNVITKSGTNAWHGSLFESFISDELNARNQVLPNKPGLTFNQFGASLGGPIRKNKIFVFGAYEGYRERSFSAVQSDVPSQQLRDMLVARVPEYKQTLDYFALPNQPTSNPLVGRYIGTGSLSSNADHYVVKPDVWLWSGGRLSGTYIADNSDRTIPRASALNPQLFIGNLDRVNVTLSTFSARLSGETRYGWNRADRDRVDGFWNAVDPNQPESEIGRRRIPGIGISELGFSLGGEWNFVGNAPTWSFEQKVAYQHGKHSFKFGGIYFRGHLGRGNIENPSFTYATLQDALNNTPASTTFTFGRPPYRGKYSNWGLFAQDDWKATRKLVLNLGLRYDYYSSIHTTSISGDGPPHTYTAPLNFSNFTLGPWRPIDRPTEPDAMNLGPRFGFAYDAFGGGTTVIRGGFGIMFAPINPTLFAEGTIVSPDQPSRTNLNRADSASLGIRYPTFNEDVLRLISSGRGLPSFQIVDPNMEASYAINYTLSLQQALTSTLVLETAFVANRGVKFFLDRRYNEVDRITGIRPNPALSDNLYFDNSESSSYYSWQTSLRKRFSSGFIANLHYTWGKTMNYGPGDLGPLANRSFIQNFFDYRNNRGRSFEDVAHNFVADIVYLLPRLSGRSAALRAVAGGWQFTSVFRARTGLPFTVTQASSRDRSRPDIVDFDNVILNDGLQYLNPAAFARVPIVPLTGMTSRAGTAGRNTFSAPGLWNVDASFGKRVAFTEHAGLQLRVDLLNAFNHTNPTGLVTNINSPTFGRLTGTAGARQVQVNARFIF